MIFSCGEDEEHTGIINHPGKHRLLQKWREREREKNSLQRQNCAVRLTRVGESDTAKERAQFSRSLFRTQPGSWSISGRQVAAGAGQRNYPCAPAVGVEDEERNVGELEQRAGAVDGGDERPAAV